MLALRSGSTVLRRRRGTLVAAGFSAMIGPVVDRILNPAFVRSDSRECGGGLRIWMVPRGVNPAMTCLSNAGNWASYSDREREMWTVENAFEGRVVAVGGSR